MIRSDKTYTAGITLIQENILMGVLLYFRNTVTAGGLEGECAEP